MTPHPSDQFSERTHVCATVLQCSEDAEIKSQLLSQRVTEYDTVTN